MPKGKRNCMNSLPNGNGNDNGNSSNGYRIKKPIKKKVKQKENNHNKNKRIENRKSKRKYLWDYKIKHPCKICGEDHPVCLGFHHRDKTKKESDVSSLINRSWKKLKDEISKCDVICDNCHKKLHYNEENGHE